MERHSGNPLFARHPLTCVFGTVEVTVTSTSRLSLCPAYLEASSHTVFAFTAWAASRYRQQTIL